MLHNFGSIIKLPGRPALAGIHVMLRQMFIYCHYQLRSLKVAKPVLNEH